VADRGASIPLVPEDIAEPSRADTIYTITITAFYLVAIGANLWVLYKTYGDSPEFERARRRLESYRAIMARPWTNRTHFRRDAAHVQFEAYSTVADHDPEWVEGLSGDDQG